MNTNNKTHWQTTFDYEYLKPAHFGPEDKVLTIKKAEIKELRNSRSKKANEKLCLFFNETDMGLVMNVTNCKILTNISKLPYLEDWVGLQINLHVTKVEYFDTQLLEKVVTDTIRIRPFLALNMDQAKEQLKKKTNKSQVIEYLKLVPHLYVDSDFQDEIKSHIATIESQSK